MSCTLCPRRCGADRSKGKGACGAADGSAYVARAALHRFEEPCISGTRGSGAIFFCGCNLSCIFCQNYRINSCDRGKAFNAEGVCGLMLRMQEIGAHNVNLVTPAPHIMLIKSALELAKARGLNIPVVYNTNAYELVESLELLDGLIDIYLPDVKYVSGELSKRSSGVADYFDYAAPAVREMLRQCGRLTLDDNGIAVRGVIIRHMVLPGCLDDTRRVIDFVKSLAPSPEAAPAFSLMSQYTPCGELPKSLDRRLTKREYDRAVEYCLGAGLIDAMIQARSSANAEFTPDFDGYYE